MLVSANLSSHLCLFVRAGASDSYFGGGTLRQGGASTCWGKRADR